MPEKYTMEQIEKMNFVELYAITGYDLRGFRWADVYQIVNGYKTWDELIYIAPKDEPRDLTEDELLKIEQRIIQPKVTINIQLNVGMLIDLFSTFGCLVVFWFALGFLDEEILHLPDILMIALVFSAPIVIIIWRRWKNFV
jgi:hypothetical protein